MCPTLGGLLAEHLTNPSLPPCDVHLGSTYEAPTYLPTYLPSARVPCMHAYGRGAGKGLFALCQMGLLSGPWLAACMGLHAFMH